jgi:hypothetical protein
MQKRMLSLKSRRPHLYGTRRLEAGDEYEAPVEEAIALVAERKADFVKGKPVSHSLGEGRKPPAAEPPKPAEVVELAEAVAEPAAYHQGNHEQTENALDRLRIEANSLGIAVDGRWGVARLQHEITMAKQR